MNDRITRAVRTLALDPNDIRYRAATAAQIISVIRPDELNERQNWLVNKILDSAQRFPDVKDTQGNVISSRFDETAKRGQRRSAQKTAQMIWDLYTESLNKELD
jgi:hypothetical protein